MVGWRACWECWGLVLLPPSLPPQLPQPPLLPARPFAGSTGTVVRPHLPNSTPTPTTPPQVCLAAERCGNLDFDARADMWWKAEGFHCRSVSAAGAAAVGFWPIFRKVIGSSMLWGAGTAMGEVPPYAISYHAAKAGIKNAEVEQMLGVSSSGGSGGGGWFPQRRMGAAGAVCLRPGLGWGSRDGGRGGPAAAGVPVVSLACCLVPSRGFPHDVYPLVCSFPGLLAALVNRMKNWMLGFIRQHGFWGILLLAAYPNAAFDLCGICCGHFLMPFWEFFGATLIGKGVIKVAGQTAFFVTLFREQSREWAFDGLERVVPDVLPFLNLPDGATPAQVPSGGLAVLRPVFTVAAAGRAGEPMAFLPALAHLPLLLASSPRGSLHYLLPHSHPPTRSTHLCRRCTARSTRR